jgi:hypothetical protein
MFTVSPFVKEQNAKHGRKRGVLFECCWQQWREDNHGDKDPTKVNVRDFVRQIQERLVSAVLVQEIVRHKKNFSVTEHYAMVQTVRGCRKPDTSAGSYERWGYQNCVGSVDTKSSEIVAVVFMLGDLLLCCVEAILVLKGLLNSRCTYTTLHCRHVRFEALATGTMKSSSTGL